MDFTNATVSQGATVVGDTPRARALDHRVARAPPVAGRPESPVKRRQPSATAMGLRLSVGMSIAVLAAIGVWNLRDTAAGPRSIAATTNEVATHRDAVSAEPLRAIDVVARYEADRDIVNAIPRLALIEQWARDRKSDESVDLLTHALVDLDERVRARAQQLLEWALAQR